MDFENKNVNIASATSETTEKKGKGIWKHVGLIAVSLFLALLTVIIINL
ncbi:MAG: hypothetical protein IKA12_00190 [Clostridia bacterium]|nr:hypothetical protein [Clostridia bacterium]